MSKVDVFSRLSFNKGNSIPSGSCLDEDNSIEHILLVIEKYRLTIAKHIIAAGHHGRWLQLMEEGLAIEEDLLLNAKSRARLPLEGSFPIMCGHTDVNSSFDPEPDIEMTYYDDCDLYRRRSYCEEVMGIRYEADDENDSVEYIIKVIAEYKRRITNNNNYNTSAVLAIRLQKGLEVEEGLLATIQQLNNNAKSARIKK